MTDFFELATTQPGNFNSFTRLRIALRLFLGAKTQVVPP
jgi:hypothetical protein